MNSACIRVSKVGGGHPSVALEALLTLYNFKTSLRRHRPNRRSPTSKYSTARDAKTDRCRSLPRGPQYIFSPSLTTDVPNRENVGQVTKEHAVPLADLLHPDTMISASLLASRILQTLRLR